MGNNGSSPRLSNRLSLLAAALLMAGTAMAQDTAYQVDIAPQALDQALNALAGQTGSRILFATDIAEGRQAQGLKASLTVEQALQRLVSGSGLRVQKTGDGSYLVSRPEGRGVLEISSVEISGKAPGSTTEGTGSYTSGSTSSAIRLNLSPRETPQSVTVLTRQLLDDQNINNLTDAMVATPGIRVSRINVGTDEVSGSFISRGARINSFQIDGVPAFSTARQAESTDIYDRVEVVRGATGMMNSLGSPSATVNLIRKRPTYESQVQINAEAGNWDRYGGGFDVSGPLNEVKTVRGRLVTQYRDQGAWTDHFNQEKTTLYGILDIDLSDSTLLTTGFSQHTQNTKSPMNPVTLTYSSGRPIKFDAKDSDTPPWTYYDHKLTNTFISIEHQFSPDWIGKAEFSNNQHKSDSLYFSNDTVIDEPGTGAYFSSVNRYKPEIDANSIDAYLIGSFSLLNRQHDAMIGASFSKSDTLSRDYRATYSNGSYYIPDHFEWANTLPKPDLITQTGKSNISSTQDSLYVSTRFNINDATKLLLGGRVTDWKQDRDTTSYSQNTKIKSSIESNGLFVPYVGLVYDLNETWSIYTSYTSMFNPHGDNIRDVNGGPLTPEEGISYEAGIKASLNEGRLNSSLSVYRTELDNQALFVRQNVYENISGTKTEGIELELNGKITDNWNIGGGYSFNKIENKKGERLYTITPQHIFKIFTSYQLPGAWHNITVGGGVGWESKSHNDLSCCSPHKEDSHFTATNLMARYKITENLTTSINIDNVFNEKYLMGYNTWAGSYTSPRSFMTSIRYAY